MDDRSGRLPPGVFVVIAGPDGSGKSSLASSLALGGDTADIIWLHHRPRLLPSRAGGLGEPVTDPYGQQPYSHMLSTVKVLYYWLDYALGWLLRVRPLLRRGGSVVIERGWWDLAADPRRYRLRDVKSVVAALGRLLPSPTHTFVLTGPAELLSTRTGDSLTLADLKAQTEAYERTFAIRRAVTFLDVRSPLANLRGEVLAALTGATDAKLVALPKPSNPRWLIPREPAKVAAGALRVHRPMTPGSTAVWRAAVMVARMGGFRALPVAMPDVSLEDLRRWIPAGGAAAFARSTHPARRHALIVDHRGMPFAHAKVAVDHAGKSALAAEAANLARYGTLLRAPLRAPRLLHAEDGMVVTEAVRWRLRAEPWRLDPVLANRLGALYRSGSGSTGPAHGDFAPWNLLPTDDGWVLVDWEMVIAEAPPLFDVVHWMVVGSAHLHRPNLDFLLASLAGLEGRGWVGECLRAAAEGAGVEPGNYRAHVAAYLDASEHRVASSTTEGAREMPVRTRLRSAAEGF